MSAAVTTVSNKSVVAAVEPTSSPVCAISRVASKILSRIRRRFALGRREISRDSSSCKIPMARRINCLCHRVVEAARRVREEDEPNRSQAASRRLNRASRDRRWEAPVPRSFHPPQKGLRRQFGLSWSTARSSDPRNIRPSLHRHSLSLFFTSTERGDSRRPNCLCRRVAMLYCVRSSSTSES